MRLWSSAAHSCLTRLFVKTGTWQRRVPALCHVCATQATYSNPHAMWCCTAPATWHHSVMQKTSSSSFSSAATPMGLCIPVAHLPSFLHIMCSAARYVSACLLLDPAVYRQAQQVLTKPSGFCIAPMLSLLRISCSTANGSPSVA